MRLKNAPNLRNMLRTYCVRLRKDEKLLFWRIQSHLGHGSNFFLAKSRQMFISETSPAVLCMYKFVFKSFFMNYYISNSFLPARVAANY